MPVVGLDLPDDLECYGNHRTKSAITLYGDVSSCAQCDGRHAHQWVDCLVVYKDGRNNLAHRCRVCGGRQCDVECMERRHHAGPHLSPDGELRPVGK